MSEEGAEKNPMERVGFHGHAGATDPQGPCWAGWALGGLWCEALPRSRRDQAWARGALCSAQSPNRPGIPRGPFEGAAHTPLPSLPCLARLSGFARLFTFHKDVGLNCLRRLLPGVPGHWRLSPVPPPRSLAFLASVAHVLPQLLHALLASFPDSSPSPLRPQAFELPGAQVYCQRRDGPASPMAAHAIWGFFRWSLMPAPPQPTPTPSALERPCKGESVPPTLRKEVALSQGRKQAHSGQKEALSCANHGTWRESVLSSRDGRRRGEG